MILYIATTDDAYELPVGIGDTPTELAKLIGVKNTVINSAISRGYAIHTPYGKRKCQIVYIDDNDTWEDFKE